MSVRRWVPSLHPRDAHGKFIKKGTSGVKAKPKKKERATTRMKREAKKARPKTKEEIRKRKRQLSPEERQRRRRQIARVAAYGVVIAAPYASRAARAGAVGTLRGIQEYKRVRRAQGAKKNYNPQTAIGRANFALPPGS